MAAMEDTEIDGLLVRVKMAARTASKDVGLAMGADLYRAASKRGMITLEDFSVLGSGFLAQKLPAFERQHFVFVHPELGEWDYRFGESPNA
ncbi:hypothetical protein [Phenylobacterium sp. SCN 70-31]|uniref:hypothetical protein n=1 Tax=Phenylobacterium sp. SCN 70-31 TaxID=1660129 RepID=UPI0025E686A1|nr:hypothetical protein [Phenylobacterium sp. SCN 70-31]